MTSQSPATTRLHITPFSQELLPLVLGASIRPLATGISFHEIPTFPENNYGYVTLPTMEADKVKKKLNGSILKGRKFKVESARSDKRQTNEEDGQKTKSRGKHSSGKKPKKRKAEDNVLDGHELSPDRKIKRGWTESMNDKEARRKKEKRSKDKGEKKSKSQLNSKYTEKSECLFRTSLPPTKFSSTDDKSKKSKKSKDAPECVVHEFSQTLKHPTFLRSDDGGNTLTSTYEDDKGWVDEAGNLKEPVSERIRKDKYRPGQVAGHKEKPKRDKSVSASKAEKSTKAKLKAEPEAESLESEDWTSSSGSSSESDSTDAEDDESTSGSEVSETSKESLEEQRQPESSNDIPENERESTPDPERSSKEVPAEPNPQQHPTEVHPLEALFKRPADQKKPESDAPTQFSFFGGGDVDSEEEDDGEAPTAIAPLTPFTKRDLQDRGLRSAAPTPDTSQVPRTINWNPEDLADEHEGIISPFADSPVPKSAANIKEESDFAKWFWENRGDNNRAWKKRRRDAAKEQRQRENRRKGMKGKS
ncbi:hypothetical protein BDV19DRAFT_357185 [Aspergillus venezuelensis]